MRCGEVMRTDVRCLRQEETVQAAARLMRETDAPFVPVCDDSERVVGAVTAFDLATRVCAEDWRPSMARVREVMSSQVVACRPGDELIIADELMARFHESRVIVVDEDDVVQGVITTRELTQARRLDP